jgi:hypothetical protein
VTQTPARPDGSSGEAVTPEVVDLPMLLPEASTEGDESVARPTKLIRIAAMVRALLDEARRAPLDEAGRKLLKEIHERSIHELQEILSPDLQQELAAVTLPFSSEAPSDDELRIAQAQLVGWLEGLFHGIQTALFAQQMAARAQLEQMRQGALPPGVGGPGQQGGPAHPGSGGLGQYL